MKKSLYRLGREYEKQYNDIFQQIEDITKRLEKPHNHEEKLLLLRKRILLRDIALELKANSEHLKNYYEN